MITTSNLETDETKATGGKQVAFGNTAKKPDDNPLPKKWQRVLTAFLGGKSYNRFEAERLLSDHCLHSTVSTLQSFGVTIFRETETVRGWQGIPTRVCRYWLDKSEANFKRANSLLNRNDGIDEPIKDGL